MNIKLNYFSRLLYNVFEKQEIKISYGLTVCNEFNEFEQLLKCMTVNIDQRDEIIILSDEWKVTQEILNLIEKYKNEYSNILHISYPLNNDFSSFKNKLIEYASGDYLFQIDADEIPNTPIFRDIRYILHTYRKYDSFRIPRVNYLDGLTEEHIDEGKVIDAKNRINYPDYQLRLFKLDSNIQWINKLHETLVNNKRSKKWPSKNEDYCLYHRKTIEKAIQQHEYYKTLE